MEGYAKFMYDVIGNLRNYGKDPLEIQRISNYYEEKSIIHFTVIDKQLIDFILDNDINDETLRKIKNKMIKLRRQYYYKC